MRAHEFAGGRSIQVCRRVEPRDDRLHRDQLICGRVDRGRIPRVRVLAGEEQRQPERVAHLVEDRHLPRVSVVQVHAPVRRRGEHGSVVADAGGPGGPRHAEPVPRVERFLPEGGIQVLHVLHDAGVELQQEVERAELPQQVVGGHDQVERGALNTARATSDASGWGDGQARRWTRTSPYVTGKETALVREIGQDRRVDVVLPVQEDQPVVVRVRARGEQGRQPDGRARDGGACEGPAPAPETSGPCCAIVKPPRGPARWRAARPLSAMPPDIARGT